MDLLKVNGCIVTIDAEGCQTAIAEKIKRNPDCGFSPGSGAKVSIDETYLKLVHEVKAAQILREKFARS